MLNETPRVIPEERIRAIAHDLWREEGCPEGRADDHWARASALAAAEVEKTQAARKRKPAPKKAKAAKRP